MNADWNEFLASRHALISERQVLNFGHPQSELQATAHGTIMADLSHLSLLQVDGVDAVNFLQGQLTNDVKLLDGNNNHYSGYCTAKGRLLAIFLAFAHQDHIHLQFNAALAESITRRLKMYVLRSKVIITDVSDTILRIGIAGPQAESVLQRVFGAAPVQPQTLTTLEHATVLRLPGPTPRYQVFVAAKDAAAIWDSLQQDCTPVGRDCWQWLEIQAGIPDISAATQEAFVPQMVNLDLIGGINFKKGCYTGQEIVARTHYLGKVKRRTHLAHVATTDAPKPGDAVYGMDSSEAVGMVVSVAAAPQGGHDLLLEVRLESLEAGAIRLSGAEGPQLTLLNLPYAL